eukprot:TRINITY_DN33031_c0_g1_i2.p1 TRINITY_DN33031_c0_g1~~TRINITY_DN33031_c0_g1_i2.p1  ORF type:complete len:256 (+),score=41.54 TRINITY_DN33031_c0_g1_i2:120-887(+)
MSTSGIGYFTSFGAPRDTSSGSKPYTVPNMNQIGGDNASSSRRGQITPQKSRNPILDAAADTTIRFGRRLVPGPVSHQEPPRHRGQKMPPPADAAGVLPKNSAPMRKKIVPGPVAGPPSDMYKERPRTPQAPNPILQNDNSFKPAQPRPRTALALQETAQLDPNRGRKTCSTSYAPTNDRLFGSGTQEKAKPSLRKAIIGGSKPRDSGMSDIMTRDSTGRHMDSFSSRENERKRYERAINTQVHETNQQYAAMNK